ncbi:MAG: sulfurtransferase TusA family protein [Thaumarchaeota archaeon]|jgi:TusA-related sulfurtransferase|nr:sulfurtransferase TusA family protein [Nitrososphaerota archaeon]
MAEIKVSRTVDARGSFCPGPLMELIRAVKEAQIGEVIEVLSSDQGSKRDIPLWVSKAGHILLSITEKEGYTSFLVKKAK